MNNLPTILYEDADILVINKPAGLTVNNADTNREELTVQKWVESTVISMQAQLARDPHTYSKTEEDFSSAPRNDNSPEKYNIAEEFANRGGIVHRLDKETSGVLVVAKNVASFGKLKEQFMSRTTQKTYRALAHGKITPPDGEINAPVGRLPFNRMHFGVIAGGREALTLYKVLNYYVSSRAQSRDLSHQSTQDQGSEIPPRASLGRNDKGEIFSLVELYPKTGRTHQIRVHLKYINHPIVADPLYAGRKVGREDRKHLSRLFLHAAALTFVHPTTGKEMHIQAPLPEDLQSFLDKLERIIE